MVTDVTYDIVIAAIVGPIVNHKSHCYKYS